MSFFAEYIKTLKRVEVEDLLDLVFYRPIGYAVVKLSAPTSITPNQVTLASVVCGLAGAACMARGTPTPMGWLILAWVMMPGAQAALRRGPGDAPGQTAQLVL